MGYETSDEIWELVKKAQKESINSNLREKKIENLISYILKSRLFCRFCCPQITPSESSYYENKSTPEDIYNQARKVYNSLLQEVKNEFKKILIKSFNDNPEADYLKERLNKSLNDNSGADYLRENLNNIRDKIFAKILKEGGLNTIAQQAKEAKVLQLFLIEKLEQSHYINEEIIKDIKEEKKKADKLLRYTINELFQAILLSDETNINKWKKINFNEKNFSDNKEKYKSTSKENLLNYETDAYDIAFKETTKFICNNIHKYNEGNDKKSFIKWFSFKLGCEKAGAYQEITKTVDTIYDLDDLTQEIQLKFKQEISNNPTFFSDKTYFTSAENRKENKGIDFLQLASLRLKNSNWEEITKKINDSSGFNIKKDTYKKQFSQWLQEWLKEWNNSEEANKLGKKEFLESQQIMSLTDLENFVSEDSNIFGTIEPNLSEIDNEDDFIDYSSFFLPNDFDKVKAIMNKKIESVNFKTIFKENAEGYSLKEISQNYSLNYNTCRAFYNKCVKKLTELNKQKSDH